MAILTKKPRFHKSLHSISLMSDVFQLLFESSVRQLEEARLRESRDHAVCGGAQRSRDQERLPAQTSKPTKKKKIATFFGTFSFRFEWTCPPRRATGGKTGRFGCLCYAPNLRSSTTTTPPRCNSKPFCVTYCLVTHTNTRTLSQSVSHFLSDFRTTSAPSAASHSEARWCPHWTITAFPPVSLTECHSFS